MSEQAKAIDRAYVIACSALDYHPSNQNPERWANLFRGIADALSPHVSRKAAQEAQADHDDSCFDAASY